MDLALHPCARDALNLLGHCLLLRARRERHVAAALLWTVWLLPTSAVGQHPPGARSAALGCASTALPSALEFAANPAAGSISDLRGIGIDATQLYGMRELRGASAHLISPLFGFTVTSGVQTFGFELYRRTTFALALARSFQPGTFRSIHLGVRTDYAVIRVQGYGGTAYPTASAGVLIPLSTFTFLGASATNLAVFHRSARPDAYRTLALGISHAHGSRVMITTDVIKEVRSPPSVRVGIETVPVRAVALRAGMTTEPPRVTGGFGLRTEFLHVDVAAERHHALGWSPHTSLRILW